MHEICYNPTILTFFLNIYLHLFKYVFLPIVTAVGDLTEPINIGEQSKL